jgi:hypothetical protein
MSNDRDRTPKGFQLFREVLDEKSSGETAPPDARLVIAGGFMGGRYVPVSFVAKDWGVTPRRIRALLMDGRLMGRRLDNGYWEVRFPYSFTFGTRGPSLKRQRRPVPQGRGAGALDSVPERPKAESVNP